MFTCPIPHQGAKRSFSSSPSLRPFLALSLKRPFLPLELSLIPPLSSPPSQGGDECGLACASENHTEGWRVGGFITSLSVAAGMRVDRIELTKCSKDVDI